MQFSNILDVNRIKDGIGISIIDERCSCTSYLTNEEFEEMLTQVLETKEAYYNNKTYQTYRENINIDSREIYVNREDHPGYGTMIHITITRKISNKGEWKYYRSRAELSLEQFEDLRTGIEQ